MVVRMSAFTHFLEELASVLGLGRPSPQVRTDDEHELAAKLLAAINRFLYQHKTGLPSEYMSEFHRYWEESHREILSPRISPSGQCLQVAEVLEEILYRMRRMELERDAEDGQ